MGTLFLSERDFASVSGEKKKESKYKAKKTVVNDIPFDSGKEGKRYAELLLLERKGEITELARQVPFELLPSQREPDRIGARGGIHPGKCIEKPVVYYADFVYKDHEGNRVVEDAKGVRTADYVIKRKLMLYVHGIRIKEV